MRSFASNFSACLGAMCQKEQACSERAKKKRLQRCKKFLRGLRAPKPHENHIFPFPAKICWVSIVNRNEIFSETRVHEELDRYSVGLKLMDGLFSL